MQGCICQWWLHSSNPCKIQDKEDVAFHAIFFLYTKDYSWRNADSRSLNDTHKLDLSGLWGSGKEGILAFHCTILWYNSYIDHIKQKMRYREGSGACEEHYECRKIQYQQNTWPQEVAVGCWRLLRQSVHLLTPLVAFCCKKDKDLSKHI